LVPRVTEVNGVPRVRLVNPDHRESEAPRGRLPSPSASRISESTTSVPRTQKPTSTTPVLRGDVMAARITQGQFEQQVKNARKIGRASCREGVQIPVNTGAIRNKRTGD